MESQQRNVAGSSAPILAAKARDVGEHDGREATKISPWLISLLFFHSLSLRRAVVICQLLLCSC